MGIDHYVSGFTLSVLTFKILSRFRCAFACGLNLHINVNSLARYTKSTLLCFFLVNTSNGYQHLDFFLSLAVLVRYRSANL